MIYERLTEAFDRSDAESAWSSFVRAVFVEIRRSGAKSDETRWLVDAAERLLGSDASKSEFEAMRVEIWQCIEKKNGTSTVIRDVDDRALRALLTVLRMDGDRAVAEESADWIDTVLGR